MPPKTKFQEGEKVLCFHGPLLYEAKCIKVDFKDKQVKYWIHYNGWNKNWDEWVPESRVLKFNEASQQKQRELLNEQKAAKKVSKAGRKSDKEKKKAAEKEKAEKEDKAKEQEKKSSQTPQAPSKKDKEKVTPAAAAAAPTPTATAAAVDRSSATSSPAPDSKRKRARPDVTTVEAEDIFMSRIEVKIKIPDELKPWLVDDWDLIVRQKMLVHLPSANTVDNILDDYVKAKTAKNAANREAIMETMAGIKEYFNVMLGTQLLYKFERPQYSELMADNPDKLMSSLYGGTHLLRLFVRLGQMLAYTSLDEKCVQILLTHIHDFLKYLLKNASVLFKHSDYGIAPPEYHRKVI